MKALIRADKLIKVDKSGVLVEVTADYSDEGNHIYINDRGDRLIRVNGEIVEDYFVYGNKPVETKEEEEKINAVEININKRVINELESLKLLEDYNTSIFSLECRINRILDILIEKEKSR